MVAFTVTRGGEYLIVAELPTGTSHVERTFLKACACHNSFSKPVTSKCFARVDSARGIQVGNVDAATPCAALTCKSYITTRPGFWFSS